MGSGGITGVQPLDVLVEPVDAALLDAEITLIIRDEGPREQRTKARRIFLVEDGSISKFRVKPEEKWKARTGRRFHFAQQNVRVSGATDHLGGTPTENARAIYGRAMCCHRSAERRNP